MLFYFTGTGNSQYAAQKIGHVLSETPMDLRKKLQQQDYTACAGKSPLIFVTPTYAWRIPRVVEDWILKTPFPKDMDVYFVMTCGSEIGNAQKYLKKLCQEKSWHFCGVAGIAMPENYTAMFPTPTLKAAHAQIKAAEPKIEAIAQKIAQHAYLDNGKISLLDRAYSTVVNPLFYPLFVSAKGFHVKDTCVSCGRCVALCPLNNIQLTDGKPVWGKDCTHCMACINACPKEAIEYKKVSVGQTRYTLEKALFRA